MVLQAVYRSEFTNRYSRTPSSEIYYPIGVTRTHLFKSRNLLPELFNLSPTFQRSLRMVPTHQRI